MLSDILSGDDKTYEGTLSTSVARVFEFEAATVGLNEKALNRAGKVKNTDYLTGLINQESHAGYYPDAGMMFF